MPSQAIADFECALEVDAIAGLLFAQVRSCQRFGPGLHVKLVCAQGDDGQAASVDGNALAQFERVNRLAIGPGNGDSPAFPPRGDV